MYCSKCGSPLGTDARFCEKCGTPVASASSPSDVVREMTKATVDSAVYAAGRLSEISEPGFNDIEISGGYELKPCPFCDGEGTHPMNFDESCPVCRGAGQNKIGTPLSQCQKCDGDGKEFATIDEICKACSGKGFITL